MKEVIVLILGVIAFGVVGATTLKWYKKYKGKSETQLKDDQDQRLR